MQFCDVGTTAEIPRTATVDTFKNSCTINLEYPSTVLQMQFCDSGIADPLANYQSAFSHTYTNLGCEALLFRCSLLTMPPLRKSTAAVTDHVTGCVVRLITHPDQLQHLGVNYPDADPRFLGRARL